MLAVDNFDLQQFILIDYLLDYLCKTILSHKYELHSSISISMSSESDNNHSREKHQARPERSRSRSK